MVAEGSVLDVQYGCSFQESIAADLQCSQLDAKFSDKISEAVHDSTILKFTPAIRSGSFAGIGRRKYMEDEHVRIDDLSAHLGSLFRLPKPSAFYGVFDGHGGPEASRYMNKNVIRLAFEDVEFPRASEVNDAFLKAVENSLCKAFLMADLALTDDCVYCGAGTTALTALIFGRNLIVANIGDCRAVLSRSGKAIEMSQDHKPTNPSERQRIERSGGYIDDGYLNGVLSVSRSLGDWDVKNSCRCLISEPDIRNAYLTEEDEFLIIGCDGIWDVMTSQEAVSFVRVGLRKHNDPEKCCRELAMEALRLNTFDNLTVVVVCLTSVENRHNILETAKRRCWSLSPDAFCRLRCLLDGNGSSP